MDWAHVLGYTCNTISVACWLPCVWMFFTRKQAKAVNKIHTKLFQYRTDQYEGYLNNMTPVDPRLMRKYSYNVSRMGSDCLNRRQVFSYLWRARLGLNPYKSFTDTQMWMLGLNKPYFPTSFLNVIVYNRMKWKLVSIAEDGLPYWREPYRTEAGQLGN